jgi:putative transposase
MALLEQVGKAAQAGDVDFLRSAVKTMAEALMELEVAAKLGADPHERTLERLGYRNRHRQRDWDARAGSIELAIPRVRRGDEPNACRKDSHEAPIVCQVPGGGPRGGTPWPI